MGRLTTYNFISLDGYYKSLREDISWHKHGGEEADFSAESLQAGNVLLFGRATYQMMESFWPTPMAAQAFPLVAEGMNKAEKIVFSNTLKKADWSNTKIVSGDIIKAIKKMKKVPGKDMTLLGSGSVLTQLAEHDLVDEYQFMIDPIVIGKGTSIFKNLKQHLELQLIDSKKFQSGVVLLTYQPM